MISGCLRNDRRCQQALFDAYSGHMLQVCRRYARNEAQAEDILQKAFLQVLTHMDQYRGEGSLQGWIRRIVVNTALRTLQQESRSLPDHPLDPAVVDDAVAGDALDLLEAREILVLVRQLPDGYRMVLNLYVFEQYNHEEIATLLGISPGTSRSQLAKARKALQHMLADHPKMKCYEKRRV